MFRFVWLVLLLPCSAHISLGIRRFTLICTHCLFLWPLLKQNKDSLYIFHSLVNRMDGSKILWPCQSLHNLFILEHKKSNWLKFVTSDPWDIFYFLFFLLARDIWSLWFVMTWSVWHRDPAQIVTDGTDMFTQSPFFMYGYVSYEKDINSTILPFFPIKYDSKLTPEFTKGCVQCLSYISCIFRCTTQTLTRCQGRCAWTWSTRRGPLSMISQISLSLSCHRYWMNSIQWIHTSVRIFWYRCICAMCALIVTSLSCLTFNPFNYHNKLVSFSWSWSWLGSSSGWG